MENKKTKCQIEEMKAYPSNIMVQLRYEDDDGEYDYISIDVDMDYIRNSDFLDKYDNEDEANQDILDNLINDMENNLPDDFELDGVDNISVPSKWEITEDEFKE